jgi:hypothetical protein
MNKNVSFKITPTADTNCWQIDAISDTCPSRPLMALISNFAIERCAAVN